MAELQAVSDDFDATQIEYYALHNIAGQQMVMLSVDEGERVSEALRNYTGDGEHHFLTCMTIEGVDMTLNLTMVAFIRRHTVESRAWAKRFTESYKAAKAAEGWRE